MGFLASMDLDDLINDIENDIDISYYTPADCPVDTEVWAIRKDRSKSRIRHYNDVKAKKRAKDTARFLASKYNKLSCNATFEEESRLAVRAINAEKIANRIMK